MNKSIKKIIIFIPLCLLLFGCSKNLCNCNNASNIKNFSIIISGLENNTINNKTISKLKQFTFEINETEPLYEKTKLMSGYAIADIFDKLNIKSNYKYLRVSSNTTSVLYSIEKVKKGYLIFYEDNIRLNKPKFIAEETYGNYWVSNVTELSLENDEEVHS